MNNPVLRKELFMRLRLRQLPMAVRISLLLIAASLLGVIYYFMIVRWVIGDPNKSAGLDAWYWTVGIQTALICLIAPAVAANSITQEKEQQTWEVLIFTPLLPSEIIFGKLLARTALLALLIALFVPIEICCWIKSPTHVTGTMMLLTYAVLFSTAVFFATIGLYASWLLNRTIYAIMTAYSFVVGGLIVGTVLVTSMLALFLTEDLYTKCPLMWVNPVMMMYEAMDPKNNQNTMLFLVYGLIVYLVLTMLIIWRMSVGFRRFAYSR